MQQPNFKSDELNDILKEKEIFYGIMAANISIINNKKQIFKHLNELNVIQ